MTAARVASSIIHTQSIKDMNRLMSDLATLNKQTSSGLKASTFNELSGVIERVSGYEAKISRINTYIINNNSVTTRLKSMDHSIERMQNLASDFASLIALRRNPASASGLNFRGQAENLLQQIGEALNTSLEGRYIFSGSATDIPPARSPVPPLAEVGIPDDHYYQGSAEILNARVSDSLQISYGVTAANPVFQKLLAAIQTAIAGDESGTEAHLNTAVDLINEAVEGLSGLRSIINSNILAVNSITESHDTFKLYWGEAISKEIATDIAETSIKLTVDQTILQATFQAFARLSGLKLTDYL